MGGRAHSGGGPRKGFGFWGLTPSFLCGGVRARDGGGDKISISDCESPTPIVRQDGRGGGRGGSMVVKMCEGDHKHRQAGRQAGRHVTGHLHHMICTSLLSISLHHCNQELEPKQPGFVEPSTHS